MKLYIVRHAIAVPHGTKGIAEDDRPLTEEGAKKMREAAEGLCALGCVPQLMLSSPLPRARETAEILREVCEKKALLKLVPGLAPGASRDQIYTEMQTHREVESLMLVGHQPSLGEIAGEIAWGSSDCYLELKKGGACALEIEEMGRIPRGKLLWLLTPSILRKIGTSRNISDLE